MKNDSFTTYKLIILFMLDKLETPLTNAIISDFILEKEYTNYFNIQSAISELVETDFISVQSTHKTSFYRLTDLGKETLKLFQNRLSGEIKEEILEYLQNNKLEIVEDTSTITNYYQSTNQEYTANCKVVENGVTIVEINLTVPSDEEASKICESWKKNSQEVYEYLMKTLLLDESDTDDNKTNDI